MAHLFRAKWAEIMKTKLNFTLLIAVVCLMLSGCDWLESTTELLERISQLEKALESSNQQIQAYRQKEAEYLQQISALQAANQQLENKHRRNLDALFQ